MGTQDPVVCPPDPERVIEGLRDTGYNFNTAMADIIDNSIAAHATQIDIHINMNPKGEITVYIADNGDGRAGDFGVPQNRERIYIVGFDKRYYNIRGEYEFKFPVPPKTKTCLGDILEKKVDPKYTISERLYYK